MKKPMLSPLTQEEALILDIVQRSDWAALDAQVEARPHFTVTVLAILLQTLADKLELRNGPELIVGNR